MYIRFCNGHGVRFAVFFLLISAAGGILPPAVFAADASPKGSLRIFAPAAGASLIPGKTLVIGRLPDGGSGRVDLSVNGNAGGSVSVERNGFSASVTLEAGNNAITVRAGKDEATVSVVASSGKPSYQWHPAVEKCSGCHLSSGKSFAISGPKDSTCYRCHQRKDRRKDVHGPMGSGDCTACHDPHGSVHKSITIARPEELCVHCHDQKSSEKHMANSKGKPCTQCHDPHASDKPFLQK